MALFERVQTLIPCPPDSAAAFAADVRTGLNHSGQKWLPCKYLYDSVGSALFEAICWLPEYGLTRADERILKRNAEAIAAAIEPPLRVAELGSGSGRKTRWILEAVARRAPTTYYPIEISRTALEQAERELDRLEGVSLRGFEAEYLDGLARVAAHRHESERLLVLFLGSSIGNFNRHQDSEFLQQIRDLLQPGDALLLGADLVKSIPRMLEAYDDPAGVTAAFNLNLLARVNRELGGNFDVRRFTHVALYNETERRMEMYLRARDEQRVRIPKAGIDVDFRAGETIWTECSYKYTVADICQMAAETGFRVADQWIDEEWPFAESLLVAC